MTQEDLLQREELIKMNLNATLKEIIKIKPDSLVRKKELGTTFNFEDCKPIFERTINLFLSLNEVNLENIPGEILQNLYNIAEQALMYFQKVINFNPETVSNNVQERKKLKEDLESNYNKQFNTISPILAYTASKRVDSENMLNTTKNLISKIENDKESAEQFLSEIQDTYEEVRNAAAGIGVAQHAIHFKEQADEHKTKTTKWLIATCISAAFTLAWGFYLAIFYSTKITEINGQSIQFGIAKLVIFTILYTATLWIGKIYKSQWHNYIVNKHRQNALSSFETFVKATSDEQTKNAVLIQATNSIFSPQNSGFISGTEQSNSPQILEIIRGVMGTPGQE